MNFKINNVNFGAKYVVNGKQAPKETQKVYDRKIDRLEYQGKVASQAQEFMQEPIIEKYLAYLPEDTFIRLHTGVVDRGGEKADEILDFNPFLSFETSSINKQIAITKELGKDGDILELSLNKLGKLNTSEIENWLNKLLMFYYVKK